MEEAGFHTLAITLKVFWVLAALLTIQSAAALWDGFRFLSFFRRRRSSLLPDFTPRAAVIIPCKGVDPGFDENCQAFLEQDYPSYQLVFAVAHANDPAYEALRQMAKNRPRIALVVSGEAKDRGEKVNNLAHALNAVEEGAEVLVFADIDARPHRDWLRSLVAPLADQTVTVSTGFRWYLPGKGFASRLRAAWDTSIATMLGERQAILAWGGSMALRAVDFRRLQVAERYWQGTVSDDYGVARAAREANGRIAFEPRCLLASREESSFGDFLRWANRQIIITRVYAARLWALGLIAHLLYGITMLAGFVLLLASGVSFRTRLFILLVLGVIQLLGIAKGSIRSTVAREAFSHEQDESANDFSCYWTLAPLVPWVMLYNFVVAGFRRQITWKGVVYHLKSRNELCILRRGQK